MSEFMDLVARLDAAAAKLTVMADEARADGDTQRQARLRGKVEGVNLALSYVREIERRSS